MENIDLDSILDWFKQAVTEKQPISPDTWLDSAAKINLLMEDLDDEIVALETEIAQMIANHIQDGKSVSQAERLVNAEPRMSELRYKKAKKNRAEQHIQIAKKRSESRYYDV